MTSSDPRPLSSFAEAVERMKADVVEMTTAFAALGAAAQQACSAMTAFGEAWAKADHG